jgi:hypothetical protein
MAILAETLAAVVSEKNKNEGIDCVEFRILQLRFSSGVTVHELSSVAGVLTRLVDVKAPSREENRNFSDLMKWYQRWWPRISPWLHLVNLRDERGHVVDYRREQFDRRCSHLLNAD